MSRLGHFAIVRGLKVSVGVVPSAAAWSQGTPTLTLAGQSMLRGDIRADDPWESVVASVEFAKGKLRAVKFQPIAMNEIGRGLPDPHDQHDVNEYMRTRGLPATAQIDLRDAR